MFGITPKIDLSMFKEDYLVLVNCGVLRNREEWFPCALSHKLRSIQQNFGIDDLALYEPENLYRDKSMCYIRASR